MESFEASGAAKRRRLTCRAMSAEGVTVKEESSAEGEVDPQRLENGMSKMDMNDLWMQLMRQTADMESHIRRLAGCDRQGSVTGEEPVSDSVKATNETGAERGVMPSSPDGSHATQGSEGIEPVGVPNEEAPRDEKAKEVLVAAAAEHPLLLVVEQQQAQRRRYRLAKQSGVPNINWSTGALKWQVNFPKRDSRGKFVSLTSRGFAVKKFMVQGRSEAEADAAALEAAKAFHAELVEKGILGEPKLKDPEFTSEVTGVSWSKSYRKWLVQRTLNKGKRIHGGYFTEKAAAEAKALELQEKHGLQLQLKPVPTLANRYAGLPVFQPKVPYPGVWWTVREQKWHAQCRVGGACRNFRVKPKDHSEAELERSFKVAVKWRKKQEKEKKRKAVKPNAKPRKK
mmetsp:Transcript_68803/g.112873  ORF Transcript_68803/g.112873 Transcript_68803/m.112873 type:complete len:398 (+) Transcript_68803:54-1247(+)